MSIGYLWCPECRLKLKYGDHADHPHQVRYVTPEIADLEDMIELLEDKLTRAEAVLKEIRDSPHQVYKGNREHRIGVADGRRCAADCAKEYFDKE